MATPNEPRDRTAAAARTQAAAAEPRGGGAPATSAAAGPDGGDGVTMRDVLLARQRIAPWVRRTLLHRSAWLSAASGADVRLKLESLQVTYSFKARGAFNAALLLHAQHAAAAQVPGRAQGPDGAGRATAGHATGEAPPCLVTASSGNHGRALATAAQALGLPCVVFAPAATPAVKLDAIRATGAELRLTADYDAAETEAKAFAAGAADNARAVGVAGVVDAAGERGTAGEGLAPDAGGVYVSPYADPRIIAGTGTIAVEILEDHPDVDTILVPIGGGGLISGVGLAIKTMAPHVRVIGVEAAHNPAFHTIRAHGGHYTPIPSSRTLADALAGNVDPDSPTLGLIARYVDDVFVVSEEAIADTLAHLVEHDRIVVEGAGAVAPALLASTAIAAANRADFTGRRVVAIVSGGNIDRARLASLLAPLEEQS